MLSKGNPWLKREALFWGGGGKSMNLLQGSLASPGGASDWRSTKIKTLECWNIYGPRNFDLLVIDKTYMLGNDLVVLQSKGVKNGSHLDYIYIYKLSSYLTENTIGVHYKDQPVSAVRE
jgi:hypothetical protein